MADDEDEDSDGDEKDIDAVLQKIAQLKDGGLFGNDSFDDEEVCRASWHRHDGRWALPVGAAGGGRQATSLSSRSGMVPRAYVRNLSQTCSIACLVESL